MLTSHVYRTGAILKVSLSYWTNHLIVYQMGRLCGGAHEISGIPGKPTSNIDI